MRLQFRCGAELLEVRHNGVARGNVSAVDEQRAPRRTPRGGKDIHPRELVGERAGQQQPERLLSIGSRRKGRSHLRLDVEVELVQLRDLVDELRSRNPGAPEHERVDIASLSRVEESQCSAQAQTEQRDYFGSRTSAKLRGSQAHVVEPRTGERWRPLVTT